MKLTDKEITSFCEQLDPPLIEPFNDCHLTPNGYDLSVDEIEIDGRILKLENEKSVRVPARKFFKIMTLERVNLPKDMVATLWLRHSYARRGVMATFGFVDAGYCGKIAMSLNNCSESQIEFTYAGTKTICQIVFEHLGKPDKTYSERSGNWQDQESLEIEKLMKK